jgi:hypothetical protein
LSGSGLAGAAGNEFLNEKKAGMRKNNVRHGPKMA